MSVRRINSLEDAQLVLNDLLNFKSRMETGAQNLKGNRVMNVGAGSADSDAATVKQLNDAISGIQVPDSATINDHYTQLWSTSGVITTTDTFPPYCVVNKERVGIPISVWLACSTPSKTDSIEIQIKLNGVEILASNLVLLKNTNGPIYASGFVAPVPKFGIGSFIVPVIKKANAQSAVSIGLVVKTTDSVKL